MLTPAPIYVERKMNQLLIAAEVPRSVCQPCPYFGMCLPGDNEYVWRALIRPLVMSFDGNRSRSIRRAYKWATQNLIETLPCLRYRGRK